MNPSEAAEASTSPGSDGPIHQSICGALPGVRGCLQNGRLTPYNGRIEA